VGELVQQIERGRREVFGGVDFDLQQRDRMPAAQQREARRCRWWSYAAQSPEARRGAACGPARAGCLDRRGLARARNRDQVLGLQIGDAHRRAAQAAQDEAAAKLLIQGVAIPRLQDRAVRVDDCCGQP
jgi:hypothetical protein